MYTHSQRRCFLASKADLDGSKPSETDCLSSLGGGGPLWRHQPILPIAQVASFTPLFGGDGNTALAPVAGRQVFLGFSGLAQSRGFLRYVKQIERPFRKHFKTPEKCHKVVQVTKRCEKKDDHPFYKTESISDILILTPSQSSPKPAKSPLCLKKNLSTRKPFQREPS